MTQPFLSDFHLERRCVPPEGPADFCHFRNIFFKKKCAAATDVPERPGILISTEVVRSKIETANQPDGGLKMEENWLSRRIMGQKRRVITGISTFFCASRVCVWCCCDSYQVWFETRRSNSCYQATDSTLPAAGSFPKKSSQDARLFLLNFF